MENGKAFLASSVFQERKPYPVLGYGIKERSRCSRKECGKNATLRSGERAPKRADGIMLF